MWNTLKFIVREIGTRKTEKKCKFGVLEMK